MAKFLYIGQPELDNTPVIINIEKANYVVFNEKAGTAVFWFAYNDVYTISAKKEEIMNLIQEMDIPIFNRK